MNESFKFVGMVAIGIIIGLLWGIVMLLKDILGVLNG